MDKQSLDLLLGQGLGVERIAKRFGKDPSTISYWMKKHGLVSPYREKHAAKGGIEQETLAALVEAGMTIAEIAEALGRSKATVGHWLRKYGMRTQNARGRRPEQVWRAAKEAGQLNMTMTCSHHRDPASKEFNIALRGVARSLARVRTEARKCVLLCANCHSEVEGGMAGLPDTVLVAEDATG